MPEPYLYRREDNGHIIEADFEEMMRQDVAGYITTDDGVQAHRCVAMELARDRPEKRRRGDMAKRPIVSDSMGFGVSQLADFERDRRENGFTDVEFTRDPDVPQFYQVRCGSRKTWDRYVKHRGLVDKNRTSGASISASDLRQAEERVCEKYGSA